MTQACGDFVRGALVGGGELFGGQGVGRSVAGHGASAHREMEVVATESGVTAGFGVAAGAHHGDAERRDRIPEGGGFAGAQDDAGAGEVETESAEQLDEVAVVDRMRGLESAGGGAQTGEADREVRFPTGAQQVV